MENKIENVQSIQLVDGVFKYSSKGGFKPFIQSVDNRTAGFSLELSDVGKYIRVNSGDAVTVTIPNIDFPIGSVVAFEQTGAGAITVASSAYILRGNVLSNGQYTVMQIIKVSTTEWTIIGGIESV